MQSSAQRLAASQGSIITFAFASGQHYALPCPVPLLLNTALELLVPARLGCREKRKCSCLAFPLILTRLHDALLEQPPAAFTRPKGRVYGEILRQLN